MGFLDKLFGKKKKGLRTVPGAGVYKDTSGQVMYNMLDPWMRKFMGRCIACVREAGIKAKGTGQFSILLGDNQDMELKLDPFWAKFQKSQDEGIFGEVAEAARNIRDR